MQKVFDIIEMITSFIIIGVYKLSFIVHIICVVTAFVVFLMACYEGFVCHEQHDAIENIIIMVALYFASIVCQQLAQIIEIYFFPKLEERYRNGK